MRSPRRRRHCGGGDGGHFSALWWSRRTRGESVVTCVRLAAGSKITREVRSYETTMSGLLELLAWLTEPVTIAFCP